MHTNKIDTITTKLTSASRILIIASKPIDYDSIGSSLALQWWLNKMGREDVDIVCFGARGDLIGRFPNIEKVNFAYPNDISFKDYDVIALLDGCLWFQFFTQKWEEFMVGIDKSKFVNIDHHLDNDIEKELGARSLRIQEACTGKLVYDYFIKPSHVELDKEVATYLFYSLVGDTGRFGYNLFPDTFEFAQKLYDQGIEYLDAVEIVMNKKVADATAWAINNTEYIDEIKSTILAVDEDKERDLEEKFGSNWAYQNLLRYYMVSIMRTIEGYPYSVIFQRDKKNNQIIVTFRTNNLNSDIDIAQVLRNIGFAAGGHMHAGSGRSSLEDMSEVKRLFVEEMEKALGYRL